MESKCPQIKPSIFSFPWKYVTTLMLVATAGWKLLIESGIQNALLFAHLYRSPPIKTYSML